MFSKLRAKWMWLVRDFARVSVSFNDRTTLAQLNLVLSWRQRAASGAAPIPFRDVGFSLYSQHEEDGILQYIFALVGTTNKQCVEICAGDGWECNTANLIINHRWTGLLFDGNPANVARGNARYKEHPATRHWPPILECQWITRSNVNELIAKHGIGGEIDLLSLDIDGIDYWLWESIDVVLPRVVVLEFNHLWGAEEAVTVPYSDEFRAEFTKYGSDYAGASLAAFVSSSRSKKYRLVGTNAYATNAFFVRNDIQHPWLPEVSPKDCLNHPRAKFGIEHRLPLVRDKEWIHL